MLDYLNYKLCFSIIHFIITNFNNAEKIYYYNLITKLYKKRTCKSADSPDNDLNK